jgi:CRISPR-associated protein Csm1
MDETVLKVAIAAFMHDIGKLADEGVFSVEKAFLRDNADLYQPFYSGRHTHRHAVYTAAFIEYMEKILPKKLNSAQWGLEDSFINLAAGHHKPETPMQWIIAVADRISSGWDRATFEEYNRTVSARDYRKTRLFPLFERLMHETAEPGTKAYEHHYCYPLEPVAPQSIFPIPVETLEKINNEAATEEYQKLFDGFLKALEKLLHKEESLQLWFEHFESLMMIFGSSVPAARAGNIFPDVSLYDHSKTTSALAVALYCYHKQTDTMRIDEVKDYEAKKFLVVAGDFYGIQNFIFSDSGETGRNRSKILRGRSFAVSLFSELAADMFCRSIGIPSISIVFNAAGKYTVVAPNTEEARVAMRDVETKINDWLMSISYGEASLGMSCIEASAEDFTKGGFSTLWDRLAQSMDRRKYRKVDLDRFGGSVTSYLDGFRNDLRHPLCPFCGKRPSSVEVEGSVLIGEGESACKICRDHIFLGAHLVKRMRLAVTTPDADIRGRDKLLEPIFGGYGYQVAFQDGALNDLARRGKLLKYWDVYADEQGKVTRDATMKFINGYVPVTQETDFYEVKLPTGRKSGRKKEELIEQMEEGAPKTFGLIANQSLHTGEDGESVHGIEALGVLKADVDQLGILMTCGLKPERFTLSRVATLSRQMNWYFALYLPHLLRTDSRFMNIYTVFAGGDDLFLIGPWNRIIDLAGVIQTTFAEYVCFNKDIHFSAGITLHKPHAPLERLAGDTEAAIESSKHGGRNRLTLFSETVTWDEFSKLQEIQKTLSHWCDKKLVNSAMIYRLNQFIEMAETERRIIKRNDIHLKDMECLKWHALFSYTLARNSGKDLKGEAREAVANELSQIAGWLKSYGAQLKIALWDVIYNRRKWR